MTVPNPCGALVEGEKNPYESLFHLQTTVIDLLRGDLRDLVDLNTGSCETTLISPDGSQRLEVRAGDGICSTVTGLRYISFKSLNGDVLTMEFYPGSRPIGLLTFSIAGGEDKPEALIHSTETNVFLLVQENGKHAYFTADSSGCECVTTSSKADGSETPGIVAYLYELKDRTVDFSDTLTGTVWARVDDKHLSDDVS